MGFVPKSTTSYLRPTYYMKISVCETKCSQEGLKWEISANVCDHFQTSGLYLSVQWRNSSVFTFNQFLFHLISKISLPRSHFICHCWRKARICTLAHINTALNWLCHLQMRIRLKTGSDNGKNPLRQKWYMGMKTSLHTHCEVIKMDR